MPLTRTRRALLTVLLAALPPLLALALAAPAPAAAGGVPITCAPGQIAVQNPVTGIWTCVITAQGGASPSAPSTGGGGSPGGPAGCYLSATRIPCQLAGFGTWDPALMCYVQYVNPQPPTSDPVWGGHRPGDGSIWALACPSGAPQALGGIFAQFQQWFATPPIATNAAALAAQALAQLTLRGPAIGMAPQPGALALVGLPVWLWDRQSPQTYGPQSATASAGATSVTATATVTRIRWSMGEGGAVACAGPGTPYQPSYGGAASPTCGYTYAVSSSAQSAGVYTVTATSTWSVTWTASDGQRGALTLTAASSLALKVGELQVLSH